MIAPSFIYREMNETILVHHSQFTSYRYHTDIVFPLILTKGMNYSQLYGILLMIILNKQYIAINEEISNADLMSDA